ncbi:cation-dependent mannose-6-phosphate receptor-like [Uloborus diversus]|uniref:cation-dependent mannose-6-phosphate receptor-like n=1 Tax=Uloborus diversus TaxID=327109 RepID=UPI002409540B|nr:cation-dependent mannose-6-phosphate receptor-like [Uloborus diversus]
MKKHLFIFFIILKCALRCLCDCVLLKPTNTTDSAKENALLDVIKPLNDHVFRTKDIIDPAQYSYKVSICGKIDGQPSGAGAIQETRNKTYVLGRYDKVDIMGGTDWILLIYYGGDMYHTHCNNSHRVTQIMIICDPDVLIGKLEIIEERRSAESSCYYLFEIGSNVSCTARKRTEYVTHGLSSGSVFCILFFTFAFVYLVIGVLYKRIVLGAKGMEQIPNYCFWKDFGNLQADGCDYFCRWGLRHESQAYRGIDDHLKTDEERDDQLLNM